MYCDLFEGTAFLKYKLLLYYTVFNEITFDAHAKVLLVVSREAALHLTFPLQLDSNDKHTKTFLSTELCLMKKCQICPSSASSTFRRRSVFFDVVPTA